MIIKSIKYQNYRCFKNVNISFDTTLDKNIFLVVAPNGGGKTEMLFSFHWVLYGFDFGKLQAKESTPYALNSTLYQNLLDSKTGDKRSCSIELVLESEGRTYNVMRTETYKKEKHGVSSCQAVKLSSTDDKGRRSLPIEDEETFLDQLSRIIPQNILQGIIFDGERMKQLSQVDDSSKKAVEGVIRQITNEDLFERCKTELKELRKENSKLFKQQSQKYGGGDAASAESKIQKNTESIERKETEVGVKKYDLKSTIERLESIHLELSQHEESKRYEDLRSQWKKELEDKTKSLDTYFDYLYKDLFDAYLLISDDLLDAVENLLQDVDIPAGLTVEAVRNIMSRDTCICGHKFDADALTLLNDLISKLPPDNINSTIGEMVRQTRLAKDELKDKLARNYKEMHTLEKEIDKLKEQITNISTQISEGAPQKIKELEKENAGCIKKQVKLEDEIATLEEDIINLKKEIIQLRKERDDSSRGNIILKHLTARESFINKCLSALDAIDEYNKRISLQNINARINEAYEMLSEDYENGRRLYIVQYDKSTKYRLASYLEPKFNSVCDKLASGIEARKAAGETEEEIRETAIQKVLESNSTGQAKINTLAFAKAILDYSREKREDSSTEISRSYPFLIDSPFTELSDGNLMKSAKRIHEFAEQVILMISNESLSGVSDYVMPYVGKVVKLEKSNKDAFSSIVE